ncbi:putative pH-induced membrane-bound redox modulator [Escherichia coli]|uniref:Putative pH-induced membrane-bound redox modulator n=1 Tax=Escherichia coli TaxID=562 RepID=A0A376RCN0_ECOLX|nr:putative pH-induced membrane-bound redox modulator [Escherichia coli]
MLFSYFSVPAALQRRVLVYGVLGAIVLRTIMIFTGSWLISPVRLDPVYLRCLPAVYRREDGARP